MGILDWLSKLRKQDDAAAIRRADEITQDEPQTEREVWSGDVEGVAADDIAAERLGGAVTPPEDDPIRPDP
jgi:hypothetical protein